MSNGAELYVRCMSIDVSIVSSAWRSLVWASHTQYFCEFSGPSLACAEAIDCEFGNAGCLSTSLRRSCVGSRCVMIRIQCVSRLSPMAALNASRTSVALGFVVRILFRNRVGWSVRGPRSVPTLSGPCPVAVSRPCLSVYAVFHPCFSVKVCGCCLCSTL